MAKGQRNFDCPNTGVVCSDSRCKRTRCVRDVDDEASSAILETEAEIREISEKLALYHWRKARVPSATELERLIAQPEIRAEAERIFTGEHIPWWYKRLNSI